MSNRSNRAGSTTGDAGDRAQSERDYRGGRDPRHDAYRAADPRGAYYQDYYYRNAMNYPSVRSNYGSYRQTAAYPTDYYSPEMIEYRRKWEAYYAELREKNPAAYNDYVRRSMYAQSYAPSVTTGPGTAAGSIAASEADRASVHSGRSSVNEDLLHKTSQAIRGSTTGLEQTVSPDFSLYHVSSYSRIAMFPYKK